MYGGHISAILYRATNCTCLVRAMSTTLQHLRILQPSTRHRALSTPLTLASAGRRHIAGIRLLLDTEGLLEDAEKRPLHPAEIRDGAGVVATRRLEDLDQVGVELGSTSPGLRTSRMVLRRLARASASASLRSASVAPSSTPTMVLEVHDLGRHLPRRLEQVGGQRREFGQLEACRQPHLGSAYRSARPYTCRPGSCSGRSC